MRHSVSQANAKADKAISAAADVRYLSDYMSGASGHTIAFSWNGEKLLVYVDGNLVRSW